MENGGGKKSYQVVDRAKPIWIGRMVVEGGSGGGRFTAPGQGLSSSRIAQGGGRRSARQSRQTGEQPQRTEQWWMGGRIGITSMAAAGKRKKGGMFEVWEGNAADAINR